MAVNFKHIESLRATVNPCDHQHHRIQKLLVQFYLDTFNYREAELLLNEMKIINRKEVKSHQNEIEIEILRAKCFPKMSDKERALQQLYKADRYLEMLNLKDNDWLTKVKKEWNNIKREVSIASKELVFAHRLTVKIMKQKDADLDEIL